MPLVQIRDVPEATVRALRARAAERGMSLAAYLREELTRLSTRPTNAEIVERMVTGAARLLAGASNKYRITESQ